MISVDFGDLDDPAIVALLKVHLETARAATAPGSAHALDLAGLKVPGIAFFAARDKTSLCGVAALKRLDGEDGELKSMHVVATARRKGVGSALILHIISHAQRIGLERLWLETGSWDYFHPARALYARHGFVACEAFGDYRPDRHSVFMMRGLSLQGRR